MNNAQLIDEAETCRKTPAAASAAGGARCDSDADLLGRFLDKEDQSALAAIVRRHQALVMGVALRYVRERNRADDVFQATFLILAENARKIRRRASLASWLHGVARRVAIRALKERRHHALEDLPVEPSFNDPELTLVGEAFDQQQIDEAFNSLPEKYREPLLLHYLEGLTAREVANQLHLSLEAVESRIRRGRDHLRRQLMKQGVTLAAFVALAEWTPAFAQEAATETLVQSTALAASSWATQSPLTGCTPQAAHLAGKELASMTTTNLVYAVASTAVLGLTAGLTLGQIPVSSGTGGSFGAGVNTALGAGSSANETDAELSFGLAQAAGPSTKPTNSGVIGGEGSFVSPATNPHEINTGYPGRPSADSRDAAMGMMLGAGTRQAPQPADLKGYRTLTPRRQAIEQALDQELPVEFHDAPLSDVLDYLSESLSIPIVIDTTALEEEGLAADMAVSLTFSDLPARSLLAILCERLNGLDVVVKHDVLTITTRSAADSHFEVVVYEMRPFAPLTPVDVEKVLTSTTGAQYWQESGGEGTIVTIPGAIVIRQTQRVHREIVEVLDQLAKFVRRTDLGEPAPLPEERGFLGDRMPGGLDGFGGGGGGGYF